MGSNALQILLRVKEARETVDAYAATPKRLATDFACPTTSSPLILIQLTLPHHVRRLNPF
jgi:hypothetical protein